MMPDAIGEPAAAAAPDAGSAWPPTPPPAVPPADGGAGFGMPAGQGFGAPSGSSFDTPPAGWSTPGAPGAPTGKPLTPRSGRPRVSKGLIIGLVVLVVVVGGLFLFRDRLTGDASDLAIGDCFDVPSANVDISSVQHHPCTESHTGEIFFITNYPDAATYPADNDFIQFAVDHCNPVFTTYVGATVDNSPDLTVGLFYPQSDGWSSGDRTVQCYATRVDGGPMTKSVKGSGGTP